MAQFYRANFAGREGNYFLWAALHQLLSVYDTVRIVGTQGKCLRPEKLVLRESFPYEELFSASASFSRASSPLFSAKYNLNSGYLAESTTRSSARVTRNSTTA